MSVQPPNHQLSAIRHTQCAIPAQPAIRHRALRSPRGVVGSPFRRAAFTLLEILVAMSIMAMMAGIAISALSWTGGGPRLSNGRHLIDRELERARSLAILKQASVRLVIYAQSPDEGGDPERYLRHCLLLFENQHGTNHWTPVDQGSLLPSGVLFIPDETINLADWNDELARSRGSSMHLPNGLSQTAESESGDLYFYYEFKSTGRMSGLNNRLVLAPGLWENGGLHFNTPIHTYQIRLNNYGLKFDLEEHE